VAATDRARSRYSLDRIAHETIAVYDKALDTAAMSSMSVPSSLSSLSAMAA
jgi:hypothetical protein